jgi:hypothetical protein
MQEVAKRSKEKSEKLKEVECGLQELQRKDQHVREEILKNIGLQKELDKLKLERTCETWLLQNDNQNLEKTIIELQERLKAQKKEHKGKHSSVVEHFSFCN